MTLFHDKLMIVLSENMKGNGKQPMKKMILLAVIMALLSFGYIVVRGGQYDTEYTFYQDIGDSDSYKYTILQDDEYLGVKDFRFEGRTVKFTVYAIKSGKAEVSVIGNEMSTPIFIYYVHRFGFITYGSFLGQCTGGNIIIVMMTIYAAIVLGIFIRKFQKNVEKDFYSYHNITLLGMIIFVSVIIMNNLIFALNRDGILDFISNRNINVEHMINNPREK